mmetsp:Transcript_39221/g.113359  ORF Transcript_39221/g.113359 Transcript_39221/m.113359 type:complete len:148 (-) Transcript_39221:139-582(-)
MCHSQTRPGLSPYLGDAKCPELPPGAAPTTCPDEPPARSEGSSDTGKSVRFDLSQVEVIVFEAASDAELGPLAGGCELGSEQVQRLTCIAVVMLLAKGAGRVPGAMSSLEATVMPSIMGMCSTCGACLMWLLAKRSLADAMMGGRPK